MRICTYGGSVPVCCICNCASNVFSSGPCASSCNFSAYMLQVCQNFRERRRHIFNSYKIVNIPEWVHRGDTWVLSIRICTL